MSYIAAWLLDGWQRLSRAVYGLCHWLVGPIDGTRKFALHVLEWFRAFFTSATIFSVLAAIQYAMVNLGMLPGLTDEKALKISGVLSAIMFFLHLGVQFFQASPAANPMQPTTLDVSASPTAPPVTMTTPITPVPSEPTLPPF